MDQLPELLSAVVSEGFDIATIPGAALAGAAASGAIARLLRRRTEAARDILLAEIGRGEAPLCPAQIDEAAAITFRYLRAAQEGTARLNLRLMAQVIAGQARLSSLYADQFLRVAAVLASLTREEIILSASIYRAWTSDEFVQPMEINRRHGALARAAAELVPSVFKDHGVLSATAAAIVRTGLLETHPGIGGTAYWPTQKLADLISMCPFDAALSKEPDLAVPP